MKQKVIAIRPMPGGAAAELPGKTVSANQRAIDALALNSGTWRIEGVPGLYLRCRAQTRSYFLQRRVRGCLTKQVLGERTLKEARGEAMKEWARMKPAPADGRKTFQQAFDEYLAQRELSPKTREIYEYNSERYLADWRSRHLLDIGDDRGGVRALYHQLVQKHGAATGSQVVRMFAAVYRYARRVDRDLPESPTIAVDLPAMKSRDWAFSPDQLRAWWRGVKTLGCVKRFWWLTALFTGARRASVEALQWSDIDTERRTIRFLVTKGNRPYSIPAPDQWMELLKAYRDSGQVPPSQWVFPSNVKPARHLVQVRDDKRGVQSAHHLRHTFRTTLAELGATTDQARLLMGHSMGGDVSRGYITPPLLVESLRPVTNTVAARYLGILEDLE